MRHGSIPFVKQVVKVDQDHYPERLSSMFIVNGPVVISGAWTVVRAFLDPVTRGKVIVG